MYKVSLLSASIVAALSFPALAEENSNSDAENVVVFATRSNETIDNAAASVAIISDQDIEKRMAKDLNDLFDYTPGVTLNNAGRQGVQSINIRGMEGKRVKIIVDGTSQPSQFDGGRYEFINSSAVTIDPDMVKSVTVVKGSASSLQGSNALGGVVAFQTKDPSDFLAGNKTFGGQAKLAYSSEDNSFSEHVAFANRSGDLESLVAYTRRDGEETDNFADNNDLQNYSLKSKDTKNNDLLVKLQYQVNPSHRLEWTGEAIHNDSTGDVQNSFYPQYQGDDETKQYRLALKHIWQTPYAFADTIDTQVSWLDRDQSAVTNRSNSSNTQRKDYYYKERKIEVESQFDKALDNHYIVYGFSYSHNDIDNTNNEYNTSSADQQLIYTPKAKEQTAGLFIQDEIYLFDDALKIIPGLRYDYYSTEPSPTATESFEDSSDSALTARLGANYALNAKNSVYAQISQGFRAPAFDELYYTYDNPTRGYINTPNPDLNAEKSIAYELGYRYRGALSSTEFNMFYSDYDDFIERTVEVLPSGIQNMYYDNLNKATIKGVELANSIQWYYSGLSTRVAATYAEGEDGDGSPIDSVNPWNGVIALNYDDDQGLWGTGLTFNYTASKQSKDISESARSSQTTLPSSQVVDLTAYYKPIKDVTIRAGVFNLTNEEYYLWNDVRGDSDLFKDNSQAKRNYSLSVMYQF